MQIKLIRNKFSCGTKRCIFKFKMLAGIWDTLYISLHGNVVEKVYWQNNKFEFASQSAAPTSQMVTHEIKTKAVDAQVSPTMTPFISTS